MAEEAATWTIVRTVEEIEVMADAWLAGDESVCAWTDGMAMMFGSEAAWPLMLYVQKFLKEGHDANLLDDADALEKLQERLEFLIEKADGERGLSAPKAREQVCAYLWLFGREDTVEAGLSFSQTASRARDLLAEVQAQQQKAAVT